MTKWSYLKKLMKTFVPDKEVQIFSILMGVFFLNNIFEKQYFAITIIKLIEAL
jgi:hypothetical protein